MVGDDPESFADLNGHDWFYHDKKWQWQKGHVYHDAAGHATKDKGYAGLLAATAIGTTNKGGTLYSLTPYDQNQDVARGTAFSGGKDEQGEMHPSIKDGNYMFRLDKRDPNGPNTINPNSPLGNPPTFYGIQKMHDIEENGILYHVEAAYGPIRARMNPMGGPDEGDFFHGQTNGHGYTHGCLCYGTDTRFIYYMWKNMPQAPMPAAVDTPVDEP